tara:strand:- start:521 stop:673 length:153 start_codon:yes stop_codon:yes gene_type:complete
MGIDISQAQKKMLRLRCATPRKWWHREVGEFARHFHCIVSVYSLAALIDG